jgi:hypothetical protein
MNGRNIGWAAGFVAAGVIAGGVLAGTLSATAQTPSPSTTDGTTQAPSTGHHGGQRADETLLTGSNAAKAKAAALQALPGATVERVETDGDGGGVYEAHVVKADGSRATVLFDKDFAVLSVQDGMGKDGPGADTAPTA